MTLLVRYNLGKMQKGTVISIEGYDHKFKKSNNQRKELIPADSCAPGDQFYPNLSWMPGIFSCCNHSGKLRCKAVDFTRSTINMGFMMKIPSLQFNP